MTKAVRTLLAVFVVVQVDALAQIGSDWVEATAAAAFEGRVDHTSVVYDGKMWVIGGDHGIDNWLKNDVWWSADGVSWTEATSAAAFSKRAAHQTLVYDGGTGEKMWVIGGGEYNGINIDALNDVWYSSDGTSWSQVTPAAAFPIRAEHKCVVFNNKMWVIAGYDDLGTKHNDVWYSTDGTNWIEATASAAFSPRGHHSCLVFDDGTGEKMWMIGGLAQLSEDRDDVWYSSDGTIWTQATNNAAFGLRAFHESEVYDGKMWVIGGYVGATQKNDVWYSTDGATWVEATASAGFGEREEQTHVVFNNKLWTIGGSYSDYYNDVWYTPPDPMPTESPTSTRSPTVTKTTTMSSTPTVTPTITFSLTVSPTWTITPTLTYSATYTTSPTMQPTSTATPTFTFTPKPEAQEIVVYPNPFNPGKAFGGTLKFKGLPDGAKVMIYTVSGELVRELTEEGGAAYWDGKNKSGAMVSIGSYVYVIKKNKESLKRGRIVVLK